MLSAFYREVLGSAALLIAIVGYVPYLWSIIRGKTKPHLFTWVIWGTLTAIAFFAQLADNAGPGAWVTGFTAVMSFVFVALSLNKGEKNITRSDWASFIGAVLAIPLWYTTKDPVFAVVLVTVIDALGFYPTLRKSYYKPHEELLFTYALSGIKFIFALFALESVTLVTALYPFSLVVLNGGFVLMVFWRRKVLGDVSVAYPPSKSPL